MIGFDGPDPVHLALVCFSLGVALSGCSASPEPLRQVGMNCTLYEWKPSADPFESLEDPFDVYRNQGRPMAVMDCRFEYDSLPTEIMAGR